MGHGGVRELPPHPPPRGLTCPLQRHLHGVGDLLLLRHAAQVGQPGAAELLLGDGHLQQGIVRICAHKAQTHNPAPNPPVPRQTLPVPPPTPRELWQQPTRPQPEPCPAFGAEAASHMAPQRLPSCAGLCHNQRPLPKALGQPHGPHTSRPPQPSRSPSPPVAAIPASAAEAAAALLASSSCRCLCSSMETRSACGHGAGPGAERGAHRDPQLSPARRSACSRCGPISPEPAPGRHSGPRQTRSHWRRGPAWRLPPRPGSGS